MSGGGETGRDGGLSRGAGVEEEEAGVAGAGGVAEDGLEGRGEEDEAEEVDVGEEIDKVGEEEEKLDVDVVGGGWFRGAGTIRTSSLRRPGGGPNSPRSEPVDHHSS